MNKVILMGRLTRDPEVRYSQGSEPLAVARYTLAVNKRFKRAGEPDADFIGCVAFGKAGEFAEKYFRKGQMIAVTGSIQTRNYEDKSGNKRVATDVVVANASFCGSKNETGASSAPRDNSAFSAPAASYSTAAASDFEELQGDDDLPF